MNVHKEEELLMAERAVDWLRKLQTGTQAERDAALSWLKESPRHVRELLLAATWDHVLDYLDPERRFDVEAISAGTISNVTPLHAVAAPSAPKKGRSRFARPRKRSWWAAGLAACAVALTVASFDDLQWMGSHTYSTSVGEQRTIKLKDGSVMMLNAQSRVTVDMSRSARELHLRAGQAMFQVQHDPVRPFRVHVGSSIVQAIGTEFDVNLRQDRTTIAVLDGVVEVSTRSPPTTRDIEAEAHRPATRVAAGETARIVADDRVIQKIALDVMDVTAWRQRRLVFTSETLENIAMEFNRYNRAPKIRVEDEILRSQRFWGTFDADDPESLAEYLAKEDGLAITRIDGAIVIKLENWQ